MKHKFYLTLLAIVCWHYSFGQDQYLSFDFTCTGKQTRNGVISIDRRTNHLLLGYMPIKGYSGLANIRFKGALADSISNFFTSQFADQNREGVLILENFFLNRGSSPAKLVLSLRLYSQTGEDQYAHICSIDTISAEQRRSFGRISELFCEMSKLVNTGVVKPASDTSFVRRVDLIPIYRFKINHKKRKFDPCWSRQIASVFPIGHPSCHFDNRFCKPNIKYLNLVKLYSRLGCV